MLQVIQNTNMEKTENTIKSTNKDQKSFQLEKEEMEKREKALLNILEDMEREKIKSRQMAKDLKKYQLAVENASDQIVITDREGKIIYANKATEGITGYASKDIVGKKAGSPEIWGGLMDNEFYQNFWKTILTDKQIFEGEIRNRKADGREYIAEIKVSPILDENNEVIFFVGIERDITKSKEVDRMKTEFISLASHQLRTPLSGMKWLGEILLNGEAGKLNENQQDVVKKIYTSNERMIKLVTSLLNVSRIESGRIIIEPEPTQLSDLVEEILSELKPKISEKQINIVTSYNPKQEEINVDKKLIGEVYSNLLTNAIKYTPNGGEVKIMISDRANDVITQISDTGYGIPKTDMNKIFDKFYRASNILKKDTDGNGLGMYLVKAIIESSQGKIWIESEENVGTNVWFTLPKKPCRKPKEEITLS